MKKWIKKIVWIVLVLICVLGVFSEANSKRMDIVPASVISNIFEIAKTSSTVQRDWIKNIPEYSGMAYVEINQNKPFFRESEYTTKIFRTYSKLDSIGRCGTAAALVGTESMPKKKRSSIGMVRPTGWHTVRYDSVIKDKYLYNRCHLIAFELSGENANPNNLITGTRYMNTSGMRPFENMVAEYIKSTKNHVLYRVTPVFDGNNLLASGVLMEAYSIEDNGSGIMFNVYCYNVQPGIKIDYSTGNSRPKNSTAVQRQNIKINRITYILNTNTKKFHTANCSQAARIKDINRKEYVGIREDIIAKGYKPCKNCRP